MLKKVKNNLKNLKKSKYFFSELLTSDKESDKNKPIENKPTKGDSKEKNIFFNTTKLERNVLSYDYKNENKNNTYSRNVNDENKNNRLTKNFLFFLQSRNRLGFINCMTLRKDVSGTKNNFNYAFNMNKNKLIKHYSLNQINFGKNIINRINLNTLDPKSKYNIFNTEEENKRSKKINLSKYENGYPDVKGYLPKLYNYNYIKLKMQKFKEFKRSIESKLIVL